MGQLEMAQNVATCKCRCLASQIAGSAKFVVGAAYLPVDGREVSQKLSNNRNSSHGRVKDSGILSLNELNGFAADQSISSLALLSHVAVQTFSQPIPVTTSMSFTSAEKQDTQLSEKNKRDGETNFKQNKQGQNFDASSRATIFIAQYIPIIELEY